jgi:hypothetical protein
MCSRAGFAVVEPRARVARFATLGGPHGVAPDPVARVECSAPISGRRTSIVQCARAPRQGPRWPAAKGPTACPPFAATGTLAPSSPPSRGWALGPGCR